MKSLLLAIGSSLLLLVAAELECYGPELVATDERPRQKEFQHDIFVLKGHVLPPRVEQINAIKIWAARNGRIDLMVWEEAEGGVFWKLIAIKTDVPVRDKGFSVIEVGNWRIPPSRKKRVISFANRWTATAAAVGYLDDDAASVYEFGERGNSLAYETGTLIFPRSWRAGRQRSYSISFCTRV